MEAYLPQYASEKYIKKSPVDGVVSYVDDKIIIIKGNDGVSYPINIRPSDLQTGAGKYSGLEHTSKVNVGDKVSRHQYLTENQFIKPSYSAGANVLACYKSEMGYTYEDGVVVSESFAKKYTSLHYQNIDIYVNYINELVEFPLMKLKRDGNMIYKTGETIIKIRQTAFGGFSENEVTAPADCKIIDIQVFPANNSFNNLIKEVENVFYSKTNQALKSHRLPSMMNANDYIAAAGQYEFRKNKLDRTMIRIKVMEYRSCGIGDKLSNRHGGKGVITQIVPDEKMPKLPDGRIIHVCLNSLGVISRMNVGQLLEMHTGLILDGAKHFLENNRNDIDKCVTMLTTLFELLDGFKDKRLSKKMNSQLLAFSKDEQLKIIDYYIKNGVRIIVVPFENPKLEDIHKAAKLVGVELESKVFLPDLNRWSMNPVTYGYIYMIKLEHISSIKQNVRSIGNYISTTMMPAKPGHHRNAIKIGEYINLPIYSVMSI